MHRFTVILTVLLYSLLFSPRSAAQQRGNHLTLQSGTVSPDAVLAPEAATPDRLVSSLYDGAHVVWLRFTQLPNAEKREKLAEAGIELLSFVPPRNYLARLRQSVTPTTLRESGVDGLVLPQPIDKLAPAVAAGHTPEHARQGDALALWAMPVPGTDAQRLQSDLRGRGFAVQPAYVSGLLAIRISPDQLHQLASHPAILHVQYPDGRPEPDGWRARSLNRMNTLSTEPGTGWDGTGVVVALADDGPVDHEDFRNRLQYHHQPNDDGNHGDMTAGIFVGAGNLDPRYRGSAPGAFMHLYVINNRPHLVNATTNYTTLGTVITSTSYSQGTLVSGGMYDATAQALDADVALVPPLMHCFSAGNSAYSSYNPYSQFVAPDGARYGNITGGRKAAKSVIAVANLWYDETRNETSSRGPCMDGRIKPDIAAQGAGNLSCGPDDCYLVGGGTSAAAPSLAGVTAALYQQYRASHNGDDPESALIKALLLNTADDLGRPGPDFDFGWGRVNARQASEMLANGQYSSGTVDAGDFETYDFILNNPNIKDFRVMVYWQDPAGNPSAAKALVNDIDIELHLPNGDTLLPWTLDTRVDLAAITADAVRGVDTLNNMEQVTLNNPATGNYRIRILGHKVGMGPQKYWIVFSHASEDILVTYPHADAKLAPGAEELIRWDVPGDESTFSVQYSSDQGNQWHTLANSVPGDQRYLEWVVPDLNSAGLLVRVQRDGITGTSAPFTVMGVPQNLQVWSDGPSTARLRWDPVEGATAYEVFTLGTDYMEFEGSVVENEFLIDQLAPTDTNWYGVRAIAPAIGIFGARSPAVQLVQASVNCGPQVVGGFPYSEDFEQGFGKWSQSTADQFDWGLGTGQTPTDSTGPYAAYAGAQYAFVEANDHLQQSAILESPCLDLRTESGTAMSFAYHMYGAETGQLACEVSTNDGLNWQPLWSQNGHQGTGWSLATVDLSAYDGALIHLRFVATIGAGERSDMAIDGLSVGPGAGCTQTVQTLPYTESFDLNLGLWTQELTDGGDWTVAGGATPSPRTGPAAASHGAMYIYTEASHIPVCSRVSLRSPCFDLSAYVSPALTFDYHMYGSAVDEFYVEVSTDCGATWPERLFYRQGSLPEQWHTTTVSLADYIGECVQLRLSATIGGWASDIAVDHIRLEEASGCGIPVTQFPYQEGFESGTGIWSDAASGDLPWMRNSGSTPSTGTGPSSADEGSYYLYVDAASPDYPERTAILYSQCFDLSMTNSPEFRFRYHMKGDDVGNLRLEAYDGQQAGWVSLWSRTGDQGGSWQTATADLSASIGQVVRLRFVAETGFGPEGDMAIDDLQLVDFNYCPGAHSYYPYRQDFDLFTICGDQAYVCIPDGSCPLAEGWTNAGGDDIDWSVNSGNTLSSGTGPNADHTGGGNYLFLEASSCYNKVAELISPCFNLRTLAAPELTFWYHMRGPGIGTLDIAVSTDGGSTYGSPIFSRSGAQGYAWRKGQVDLAAYASDEIVVKITGSTGGHYRGDLAIDDIGIGEFDMLRVESAPVAQVVEAVLPTLKVYPNPANSRLYVQWESPDPQATLHIVDAFGKVLHAQSLSGQAELSEIDVSQLAEGYYFAVIAGNSGRSMHKFAVLR